MADTPPYRFHHPVEVRFRDLDAMGHAHHSLALIYVEEARAAYWRDVAGRATVDDIDYVLAEVTVQYSRRITYPERLDVAVRVSRIGRKSFTMEFEIRSADGALLAAGTTVQVAYDYAAGASREIDAELRTRIEAFEADQNSSDTPADSRPMNAPST